MNKLAAIFAIATVTLLNVIVVIGSGIPNSATGGQVIATIVPIIDFCILASSVLLGRMLIAGGFRKVGFLFIGNIGFFVVARVMHIIGSPPPRWLLFSADLYWLNLYLVTLSRHWRLLLGESPASSNKGERGWRGITNSAA